MEISVRLGAGFNQSTGNPRLSIDLPEGATVADLIARLSSLRPELENKLAVAVPVVAGRHAAGNETLANQREIALLLPVSGAASLRYLVIGRKGSPTNNQ